MRFALCLGPVEAESVLLVRRILAALPNVGEASTRVYGFSGGALGVISRPGRQTELTQRVLAGSSRVTIAAGDPMSTSGPVFGVLERAHCAERPADQFTSLDGAFVAARVDTLAERVVIVTDFLGMAPAFIARRPGAVLVASSSTALLADPLVSADPDPAGWGAMLGFGNLLSERTKLVGVKRLPPAAILEFDLSGKLLTERSYWSWPHDDRTPPTVTDMRDILGDSVRAYRADHAADTVLLSGGYDSRIIAGLLQRNGDSPLAVIQRHPDENADADGRFGVLAARSMGLRYEVHEIASDFFSSNEYLEYVRGGDVDVPSLYLFISTTARLLKPERGAVWLDTVVGLLLKRKAIAPGLREYVRRFMGGATVAARLGGLRGFSREWKSEMVTGSGMLLDQELARYPDSATGVREFRVRSRTRLRIGVHFHRVHSALVPVLTPGLDRKSFDTLSALPQDTEHANRQLATLIRDHLPGAAEVPFVTGLELSRISSAAAPKLMLQQAMARMQSAVKRRPLRGLARIAGLAPFEWAPSAFLQGLERRLDTGDAAIDPAALHGPRSQDDNAALFYWCEFNDLLEAARRVTPVGAAVISLMDLPQSAGV